MARTGEPGDGLVLADMPDPVPGPGELQVAVEFAGLSFADLLLIRGEYQIALSLPCVPGSEFVGRVLSGGRAPRRGGHGFRPRPGRAVVELLAGGQITPPAGIIRPLSELAEVCAALAGRKIA